MLLDEILVNLNESASAEHPEGCDCEECKKQAEEKVEECSEAHDFWTETGIDESEERELEAVNAKMRKLMTKRSQCASGSAKQEKINDELDKIYDRRHELMSKKTLNEDGEGTKVLEALEEINDETELDEKNLKCDSMEWDTKSKKVTCDGKDVSKNFYDSADKAGSKAAELANEVDEAQELYDEVAANLDEGVFSSIAKGARAITKNPDILKTGAKVLGAAAAAPLAAAAAPAIASTAGAALGAAAPTAGAAALGKMAADKYKELKTSEESVDEAQELYDEISSTLDEGTFTSAVKGAYETGKDAVKDIEKKASDAKSFGKSVQGAADTLKDTGKALKDAGKAVKEFYNRPIDIFEDSEKLDEYEGTTKNNAEAGANIGADLGRWVGKGLDKLKDYGKQAIDYADKEFGKAREALHKDTAHLREDEENPENNFEYDGGAFLKADGTVTSTPEECKDEEEWIDRECPKFSKGCIFSGRNGVTDRKGYMRDLGCNEEDEKGPWDPENQDPEKRYMLDAETSAPEVIEYSENDKTWDEEAAENAKKMDKEGCADCTTVDGRDDLKPFKESMYRVSKTDGSNEYIMAESAEKFAEYINESFEDIVSFEKINTEALNESMDHEIVDTVVAEVSKDKKASMGEIQSMLNDMVDDSMSEEFIKTIYNKIVNRLSDAGIEVVE